MDAKALYGSFGKAEREICMPITIHTVFMEPEGGMVMTLPKAARVVGTIEKARIVYLEDYVLQYLTVCGEEEIEAGTKIILYGKKETSGGAKIYIIYGIDKQKENNIEKKEKGRFPDSNKTYRRLGHLDSETGAIVLDDWGEGEVLQGYYVFYDADETMKERLGEYYGKKLRKDRHNTIEEYYDKIDSGDRETEPSLSQPAELVALSSADKQQKSSPFLWIRIVVTGIFIIFCAIAVLAVNNYDKLYDFIQTAVLTQEMIDTEGRD